MAQSAERLLMNEFKALSKETWTNIEVSQAACLGRLCVSQRSAPG